MSNNFKTLTIRNLDDKHEVSNEMTKIMKLNNIKSASKLFEFLVMDYRIKQEKISSLENNISSLRNDLYDCKMAFSHYNNFHMLAEKFLK